MQPVAKARKLNNVAKFTKTAEDIEKHRVACRAAKKAWRFAKSNYSNSLVQDFDDANSQKRYWKIIKNTLGKNKSANSIPVLKYNDLTFTTGEEKANCLNSYFVNCVDRDEFLYEQPPYLNASTGLLMQDIICTEAQVHKELVSLNVKKATGPDNLSNILLKHCAESLVEPLTFIFQKSLQLGQFPECWKKSNVIAIYKKKGPKDSPESY